MAISPVDNVGKKNLPAIPYDQNNRRPAVLVLPVVVGGEVVGYLPAAGTDMGDGTAKLRVDSEFTLDVDSVSLTNLKVGSTDQTAANSRFLKTDADGTVQVAGVIAGFSQANIAQWGGTAQTGADLTPLFQHLDVDLSTRASEATLALLEAKDFATETTLASILAGLSVIDFATETTLSNVKTDLDSILAQLDVALSTRASESTLSDVKTDLDSALTKLDDIVTNTADLDVNTDELEAKVQSVRDQLDVLLSTRASEATLADVKSDLDSILAQLDVALSTRASEATLTSLEAKDFATETTLASILAELDVALSTRASEATLSGIKSQTDQFTFTGGKLEVAADISLTASDIEIGAVEIKNATTDDRVTVDPTGALKVQEARVATATTAAVDVDNSITPATLILAANADRQEYTVVHEDPSATVYIGFADTVTTLTGIPLVGNQMYGSNKYTGDIYAVASVAGPISVRVAEVA